MKLIDIIKKFFDCPTCDEQNNTDFDIESDLTDPLLYEDYCDFIKWNSVSEPQEDSFNDILADWLANGITGLYSDLSKWPDINSSDLCLAYLEDMLDYLDVYILSQTAALYYNDVHDFLVDIRLQAGL